MSLWKDLQNKMGIKFGASSGGKGGKIIFLSGVVFSIIVVFFGYLASLANNFVITAP